MVESGAAKPMDKSEKEMTKSSGPTNIMEARKYESKLDKIFEHFKNLLKEDDMYALKSTITEVK